MLAPDRLLETSLFVNERDLERVTVALMRERALHLEVQEGEHWAPAPVWTERFEAYQTLAQRLDDVRSALGLNEAPLPLDEVEPHPSTDREDLEDELVRFETRVGSWRDDVQQVRRDIDDLQEAQRQLALLGPLDANVEDLRTLRHHHLAIGTLPEANVDRVAAALFQVAFVLVPLERRGARTLVAASTAHEDGHVLDRALRTAFFEPVELPAHVRGAPDEASDAVAADLEPARARREELDGHRAELARDLGPRVLAASAKARANVEACAAIRHFPYRDGVYVIAGWLARSRAARVEQRVRAVAEYPLVVETFPPNPGRRDVPSLVRNPSWLRPFEALVTTFGLAGYDEVDPTLVTAIVFLFTYGMMFGDMGHGALLFGVGLLLRRATSFGTVVAAAGATATGFGALYGVAFGAAVTPPLWLQPMHAIFPLLIAAVVAGAVILNLGFALNLISAWRTGDAPRFWLDKSGVLGAALYWALLGGGLAAYAGWIPTGAWLALLAPLAAAMWFREPLAERMRGAPVRPGAHVVTGFFELFEAVIAYLSNSLSFVRLGAFAVAHEGLSGVVLQYASGPMGWAVFLLGTALIVGFEGLIVGIQALRLQYYEFFGRFFQGTGTPFRPLSFSFAGGTDA
ncbi:MAG: V-type ATPase 116kDa subunit family protein [Trueperaceae bacterium]|nr:V-type ATPase 116kDa subunit family protein [Trueperaceae bacterium]